MAMMGWGASASIAFDAAHSALQLRPGPSALPFSADQIAFGGGDRGLRIAQFNLAAKAGFVASVGQVELGMGSGYGFGRGDNIGGVGDDLGARRFELQL